MADRNPFDPPTPRSFRPLSPHDHDALMRLAKHRKIVRRPDGYGTEREHVMSFQQASLFKARTLAVAGFGGVMVITKRGLMIAAENPNGDA